jgi:hypothetical protein
MEKLCGCRLSNVFGTAGSQYHCSEAEHCKFKVERVFFVEIWQIKCKYLDDGAKFKT